MNEVSESSAVVRPIAHAPCRHWRVEYGAIDTTGRLIAAEPNQEIALLTIDVAGQSTNALSREVMEEFDRSLSDIANRGVQGLIIRSAKASGFIAGADVREFENVTDAAQAAQLARQAQLTLDRLPAFAFPSVALIHGFCLGGGLEVALACTYRVALDGAGARFGLPEVRLGIHPGFAGTVRLPRLIGHVAALDLMMTGRSIDARTARRLGLVDDVVPERHALFAAQTFIQRRPKQQRAPWTRRLPGFRPLRPLVVRGLERRARKQADPDHYPAPYRIIDLWRRKAPAEEEAASLGELLVGRTSRNLVHVFLLGEELKRRGRRHPHGIQSVHVIGAGTMGADIATWAAAQGFRVSLQDQQPEILARAVARAAGFFQRRFKDARERQAAMDRFAPDLAGHGLRRADLVIEAIVEKLDAKRALFAHIEEAAKPDAVLATNTSSIPLESIAQGLGDPSRLLGLHFFNPATRMQLVELVRGRQTADAALNRARAWTVAIDRLPLDVASNPGFLVNRVLTPYLLEAVKLLEDGVAATAIDQAAVDFGMPVGPIELADTVGLDICLSVAETLSGPLGVPVPQELRELVAQGRLGKKTGHGFYRYDAKGRPRRPRRINSGRLPRHIPIMERLVLRLLNEAMVCLRERIVDGPDAVDAGMVYGAGFAPYLGGPVRYAESLGSTGIGHSLYRLSQEYGERFSPDPGWSQPELLLRAVSPSD
ncbi:MAG TPA: 3-hydroxyacyl-CoA dehydrogenase NAD-binding domain-containing protein [Burkholderiales bacterium]